MQPQRQQPLQPQAPQQASPQVNTRLNRPNIQQRRAARRASLSDRKWLHRTIAANAANAGANQAIANQNKAQRPPSLQDMNQQSQMEETGQAMMDTAKQ